MTLIETTGPLMKRLGIIALASAAIVAVVLLLLFRPANGARAALEETRATLRADGFKTDLAEFDFTTTRAEQARTRALTNLLTLIRAPADRETARRMAVLQEQPGLMPVVDSDSAVVVWPLDRLETDSAGDAWPILREIMAAHRSLFDAACEAALSGPIRFDLNATAGNQMLLPHLAGLKQVARLLSQRALLELHDGHPDAAWTNLLATTRLVSAYEPRPVEIAHLVRYACAAIAYETTWQMLQAPGWDEEQLARLQQEWASVDYFKDWPETAAFGRAAAVDTCQLQRLTPLTLNVTFKDVIQSPRSAGARFLNYRRQLVYRRRGSYEDEAALLLHYRDRELELRQAIQSPSWSEMRVLPGVTNLVAFQSSHPSQLTAMLNLKHISMALQHRGKGMLGSVAEAEARRRLLVTAIAVERHRAVHGSYPSRLEDLVPEFLESRPIDFMDGQPLRYRVTEEGQFLLYSVGLDCMDNGGRMPVPNPRGLPTSNRGDALHLRWEGTDLVWPRPASAVDVDAARNREAEALLRRVIQARQFQIEQRTRSLAKLEQIHEAQHPRATGDPAYHGRPLAQVLAAEPDPEPTLEQLLTLRQIDMGEDPATAVFEVPVVYDALSDVGGLSLLVDTLPEESGGVGPGGGFFQTCERATNGNCLLIWHTDYDFPGKHFIQARLEYFVDEESGWDEILGPLMPFYSSNVCQVDASFSKLDSGGAIFHALLPELKSGYSVELLAPDGAHLKTIEGTTTNGVIQVCWDLIDDQGRRFTNESFQIVFHLTPPGDAE